MNIFYVYKTSFVVVLDYQLKSKSNIYYVEQYKIVMKLGLVYRKCIYRYMNIYFREGVEFTFTVLSQMQFQMICPPLCFMLLSQHIIACYNLLRSHFKMTFAPKK